MGLWSRIAGLVRGKSESTSVDAWFERYGLTSKSATGLPVTQVTSLQVSTVMACVSILAEDVAKLPVHVYRRRRDGGRDIVAGHPLERLLQKPNSWQSRFEFIEMMMVALLLRGNAYACIIRDGRGKPVALVPVNPDRVWIYEAPAGEVFYQVARRGLHETAELSSLPLMVPAEDMLHVRWLSQENSLWGISRISYAREVIGLALAQQELAARLAGNSTNLGGVLQTDQRLNDEVVARLKANWKEKFAGVQNAGQTAVLEQGLKWQPLGMTAQDAEFVASRDLQVLEICRLFRMPPHKVGVMERMAGATLEQVDQDYVNNTVSSYLERWEAKLGDTFDLAGDGLYCEFDVTRFLRASLQVRYNAYRTGIVGMFVTPNEARRAEGLPDLEGGDTLYQPTNVAPIGFSPTGAETGPGSDTTGSPAAGGDGDPAASPDDSAPTDSAPSG